MVLKSLRKLVPNFLDNLLMDQKQLTCFMALDQGLALISAGLGAPGHLDIEQDRNPG